MTSRCLSALLRSLPMTLFMVGSVICAGVVTNTHLSALSDALLARYGFAPVHLSQGAWERLLTSVFLTHGGWTFYGSVVMLALSVGLTERWLGTRATIAWFYVSHILTLLMLSLLLALPLHSLDIWWGTLLMSEHDVGPSAGYYGCLGGVVASQAAGRRSQWLLRGLAYLTVRMLAAMTLRHTATADVAHILAFVVGFVLRPIISPHEPRSHGEDNDVRLSTTPRKAP